MENPIVPVTIYTFVNDTAPTINFTITRQNVGAVDITNATVDFYIQNPYSKTRTNTGHTTCQVTDGVAGKCTYVWVTGDIPDEGIYDANIRITYQTEEQETAPVSIEVASIV